MSLQLVFDHYPLPSVGRPVGWETVSVGEVARLISSGFPSGEHNQRQLGVPHIRPMNIDREGRLDLSVLKYVQGDVPRELAKGDVVFNNTNSPELIGKTTAVLIGTRLAYSNHMTRIRLEDGLDPVFVARQLHFLWMTGYFRHRCVNHVNQASISADPLSETVPLALPPASEQTRIADALDELLSDLDAGVLALERVRAKLAQYRASVLKAAVDGTLTAEWRAEHPNTEPATKLLERILAERRRRWEEAQLRKFKDKGQDPPKNWKAKYKDPSLPDVASLSSLPEGWLWVTVDCLVVEPIVNGISVRGTDVPPGVAALRLNAMSDAGFDYSACRYLPLSEGEVDDLWVEAGDFFVCRGNGSKRFVGRGTLAQIPPGPIIFSDLMMRLRFDKTLADTRFVRAIWSSRVIRDQIERAAKTTAGIYKIAQPELGRVTIPLPCPAEQQVLVEVVEDQLAVIDHLEADLDAKLKGAQGLRQAILRHAFTGQLVPQDPNDEPASELLKRIVAERESRARGAAVEKEHREPAGARRSRVRLRH